MRPIRDGERILIENIMDAIGPAALAEAIARIADDKATHIRENWQDEDTARQWDRVAARMEAQVKRFENLVG
jgi:hypothetical protein